MSKTPSKVSVVAPSHSSTPSRPALSQPVAAATLSPTTPFPVKKPLVGRTAVARLSVGRPAPRKPTTVPVVLVVAPAPAPNLLDEGVDPGADPGTLPTDQVFDEADQAQWMQLREQADIARRGREMNRPEQHPDFDGKHCVDCDDPIPLLRLQMQRVRCVDCQQAREDDLSRARRLGG